MIAISSHKPNAPDAIALNQLRAHQSWQQVFTEILYFGPSEPYLTCPKTAFIECDNFPYISTLCAAAGTCKDFVAILNSDIVVAEHLPQVLNDVIMRKGNCATSRRWEFDGDKSASLTDFGIDFFWATPALWRQAAKLIPAHYRIGHTSFDTWLMSYFNTVSPRGFYDLTRRQVIFHPKHEERNRPHFIKAIDDKFTLNCGWPILRL